MLCPRLLLLAEVNLDSTGHQTAPAPGCALSFILFIYLLSF